MAVQCELCPKACVIAPGQSGECRIRVNLDGRLLAVTYGHPSAIYVDPVEKKPLFHFLPGTDILSLATVGCNLHCKNCQNWTLSQENPEDADAYDVPPKRIPVLARENACSSVAFTYSDPVVFYEYSLDGFRAAKAAGLRTVLVTAGYINPAPLRKLAAYVDAANVDIKAYSDDFYRRVCDGTLKPILDGIVLAKEEGVHLEITNLVIPTLNDEAGMIRDLARWVMKHLGPDTPLHFSRFFPRYQMRALPPTPSATLDRARGIALDVGLHYVYIGNVMRPGGSDTHCPACGRLLIQRSRFRVLKNDLVDGACPRCGHEIEGVWK
ncbi:MAG: AmmeMemoRadiSam system radical SAM enzyme [Planctomycetota bacterium]